MANSSGRRNSSRPTAKRQSLLERIHLGKRIARARGRDVPWKDIAAMEGIPVRTAQDIHRKFQVEVARALDHKEILDESVLLLQASVDALSREMEEGDSSSARVGAANALRAAVKDRLNLMILIGLVPQNAGRRAIYAGAQELLLKAVGKADLAKPEALEDLRAELTELARQASPVEILYRPSIKTSQPGGPY